MQCNLGLITHCFLAAFVLFHESFELLIPNYYQTHLNAALIVQASLIDLAVDYMIKIYRYINNQFFVCSSTLPMFFFFFLNPEQKSSSIASVTAVTLK